MNRQNGQSGGGDQGCSLPELMVAAGLLTALAGVCLGSGVENLARQRLDAASRRLSQGLDKARSTAEERGVACGLRLNQEGWGPTNVAGQPLTGDAGLPACLSEGHALSEGLNKQSVDLRHNLPAQLRITTNGLLLDSGTVVLSSQGTAHQRCLVVSLPLGIVREGRYSGRSDEPVNSSACRPE